MVNLGEAFIVRRRYGSLLPPTHALSYGSSTAESITHRMAEDVTGTTDDSKFAAPRPAAGPAGAGLQPTNSPLARQPALLAKSHSDPLPGESACESAPIFGEELQGRLARKAQTAEALRGRAQEDTQSDSLNAAPEGEATPQSTQTRTGWDVLKRAVESSGIAYFWRRIAKGGSEGKVAEIKPINNPLEPAPESARTWMQPLRAMSFIKRAGPGPRRTFSTTVPMSARGPAAPLRREASSCSNESAMLTSRSCPLGETLGSFSMSSAPLSPPLPQAAGLKSQSRGAQGPLFGRSASKHTKSAPNVLTLRARQAVQEEEHIARLEFERIDVNHDGVISIGELLAGLTKQGYTDEEIHVLFGRIDTNLNAKLEIDEWIRYKVAPCVFVCARDSRFTRELEK